MKPEPDPENIDRRGTIDGFPFVDFIDAYFEWNVGTEKTVFSPLLHKLTGYPVETISNDPGFWREVVHPGDFAALNSIRNWALRGNEPIFETRLRVKNRKGPWAWHLVRCIVAERDPTGAPKRVSGVMFDITEQEDLKLAVAETGSVLRQLHSITTSHGLPMQDRLHWILKTGCEHFGLPNGIVSHIHDGQYEVLAAHSPSRDINVGDTYPLGMTFCNETLEFGGAVHFEDASKTRFKSHPCYLDFGLATYIGIPIEVEDQVYGTLNFSGPDKRKRPYTATDNEILKLMGQWVGSALTRQQMTHSLRETERRLQHVQRVQTVGRLVGGVAHDINNLLTAIIGFADLARHDLAPGSEPWANLDECINSAKRGARITHRLLGFSQFQRAEPRRVNLDEVVGEAMKLVRQLVGGGIGVEFDLGAPDTLVVADPTEIDQVLMNLAVNARDAMPVGGTVTITTREESGRAIITFTDTGTGMDGKTAHRVFEPFFSTKNPGHGTGLGLPTVKTIVTQAGGTLDLKTEPGSGTTLTIDLPVAPPKTAVPEEPAAVVSGRTRTTVMLIEGEDMVRRTVAKYLKTAGHEVVAVENGEMAEGLWDVEAPRVGLMISDVIPVGGRGWDFAMKANYQGHRPLLMFMSAYPRPYLEETRHPALEYPILEKPFDFEALLLALGEILG
jgi:signal transduction histidine kinase